MIHPLVDAMFPNAAEPWRELAGSFIAWVFAADDRLERCADEAEASACAATLVATRETNAIDPSSLAWDGVRGRLSVFGSQRRHAVSFVAHVHEFLDACVWETANRQRRSPPSVESYRRMRPYTGATWPFLRMALAIGNVSLEAELHPVSQRLLAQAAWLPCLANDLVSVDKELAAGDFHNIVILQMRERSASERDTRQLFALEYEQAHAAFADALAAEDLPLNLEQRRLIAQLVTGADRWQASDARYRVLEREPV